MKTSKKQISAHARSYIEGLGLARRDAKRLVRRAELEAAKSGNQYVTTSDAMRAWSWLNLRAGGAR